MAYVVLHQYLMFEITEKQKRKLKRLFIGEKSMEVTSQKFKVVVFQVGDEEFGLRVVRVVSIERMQPITVVPKMPE